ncbi:sulfurtransferase TusA family protein [Planktomarina sp.]|nr:sulfurtransferase TusA family protein [Planktomarina sp.]
MVYDEKLDALGLLCPLPVLKARKRLIAMADNALLQLVTDDPAAVIDVPHFCKESGNELLEQEKNGTHFTFVIKKVS